jgi:hypothetical protein
MIHRAVLAVPLLVLLAACEETAPEPKAVKVEGEAAGDVLGGSISDDMLPLEQLQSQSPPLKRKPGADDEQSDEQGDAPE